MRSVKVVGVIVVALGVIGAGALWRTRHHAAPTRVDAPELLAPAGTRIRVSVLNGTKTRGLARRATTLLRDRGYDVLEIGTDPRPRDTTIVYDLTGHPDWAQRVARSFSPARVEAHADSSRYLDIVVLLGTSWRPTAQPFHP